MKNSASNNNNNNATTKSKNGSKSSYYYLLGIIILLVSAVLVSLDPKLEWEKTLRPMALKYMNTSTTEDESSLFDGLTVVVTGATSGIGKSLTQFLAIRGATVFALGRSSDKLQNLIEETQTLSIINDNKNDDDVKMTRNKNNNIIPIVVEMSDLKSVSKAADAILVQSTSSLDIIINNAGMHYGKSSMSGTNKALITTEQGHDKMFTVNYLSHVLLTEKLLPNMSKSHPTVLQMSSSYHWGSDGRDLDPPGSTLKMPPSAAIPGGSGYFWKQARAYTNSKLAQILYARKLQRTTNIRAVSVCPAWVATHIAGNRGTVLSYVLRSLAYTLPRGLGSTLYALFDESATNDFYTNTRWTLWMGPMLFPAKSLPYEHSG